MLQPIKDVVVIKPDTADAITSGGIHIPDQAQEKPQTGVVFAVGPGKTLPNGLLCPMTVAPVDHVIFSKYNAHEIKYLGEKLYVMCESDVLAVIE